MTLRKTANGFSYRELIFQVLMYLAVFLFYAYDRDHVQIDAHKIWYFLTYVAATLLIAYYLLPRFFYRKKYLTFGIGVALILTLLILLEELVLEQIFFPDTRAKNFPGVFYSVLSILPVLTVLSGFKFAWDALNKQHEVDQLRDTVRESELQFLKSQINPHFLFNNLNNLYSYAIENSPRTPDIILELSGVLRYMLYECREAYVPLDKELKQLENFTRLSELQIEERGRVSFRAPSATSGYYIAPLILIVFLENAFKHSQAGQSEEIDINVEVELSASGLLTFRCANTYQPVVNHPGLDGGIGLENVRKRLALLYPDDHQLDVHRTEDRYVVELTLQLSQRPIG